MGNKAEFLVFSDDWGGHPSSCQHIFRHIAKEHRVIWVNTIGMRNPTATVADLRKAFCKSADMLRRIKASDQMQSDNSEGSVTVCRPVMLPGVRARVIRRFNSRSVKKTICRTMNVLNVHKPIIVATVPNAVEYLERFADCKVVYYCVDDFSLWPGVESALVREMETRLIARADLIIAASSALQQRFEEVRKPASLLTHGVDVEMFSVPAGRELESLRDIRCPRVGFYGLVDGRMDWELLVNLARRMPSISFVFAGPLDASVGTPPIVNNIHFIGAIAYEKLPEFILGMSVLILPYKRNELGKVLSPLKIKEYLSTSKPVVCTPIAATVEWEGVVALGSTAVEWERLIRQFLEGGQIARDGLIMDRFIGQSWSDKAQEFLRLCVATSGES